MLLRVGEGVPLDGGSGRVVAVFRRAVYASLPGGLFALVGPDAEPGPLHAHVTRCRNCRQATRSGRRVGGCISPAGRSRGAR
jgi:hypothetical protein